MEQLTCAPNATVYLSADLFDTDLLDTALLDRHRKLTSEYGGHLSAYTWLSWVDSEFYDSSQNNNVHLASRPITMLLLFLFILGSCVYSTGFGMSEERCMESNV